MMVEQHIFAMAKNIYQFLLSNSNPSLHKFTSRNPARGRKQHQSISRSYIVRVVVGY